MRFRLATNSDFTENRSALTLEVGGMRNLGSHSAVGATIFFADPQDADDSRSGVRARYRWWLGSVAAVEVAPGILFEVNDVRFRSQLPGFSGQVAFDVGNLVGVNAQLDVVRGSVTRSIGTRASVEGQA